MVYGVPPTEPVRSLYTWGSWPLSFYIPRFNDDEKTVARYTLPNGPQRGYTVYLPRIPEMGHFSREVYMRRGPVWGTPSESGPALRSRDRATRAPEIACFRDVRKLTWGTAAAGCPGAAVVSRHMATTLSRAASSTCASRPRHRRACCAAAPGAAALRRFTGGHAPWGATPHTQCTRDVAGTLCLSSSSFLRPVAATAQRRSSGVDDSHGGPCFFAAWCPGRCSSTSFTC